MKKATVLLTTQCNLECSYCCNKMPEVREKFQITTYDEMLEKAKNYDVIHVTGGEIALAPKKLFDFTRLISLNNPKIELYGYTNGQVEIRKEFLYYLIGINIGVHRSDTRMQWLQALQYYKEFIATRVLIEEKHYAEMMEDNEFIERKLVKAFADTWTMNQCKLDGDFFVI